MDINQKIADEINVRVEQVTAAVNLIHEGATVPFIARYRKEVTGGLTDEHLRTLEDRLSYLTELVERKETILKSIQEQGKLTDKLKKAIEETDNKARLEDLYLPYKPKRRTKAQIAIEAGLEPLADLLLSDPTLAPEEKANDFINEDKGVSSIKDALEGAKQILMERFSESADLLEYLREYVWNHAVVVSSVVDGKEQDGKKYSDYFEFNENIKKVPSHRGLALLRGRKEGFLKIAIELSDDEHAHSKHKIAQSFNIENQQRAADVWLMDVVDWTWKVKIKLKIDLELIMRMKESSEVVAIDVFKSNLKNLLMAAPAGNKNVLGLDPGLRTGVKVVVVDGTGKLLEHTTIFPHAPQKKWAQSMMAIRALCEKHKVSLVSIGNGTASRETDQLVGELIKSNPELGLSKIVVNEAGASVYSASELAGKEFPDLDVSFRGAVSIARRLQDPLPELVKIDPKSIGVGQYQHDVNQIKLDKSLSAVLEDCVNAVGADLNTASVPLLKSISGLNETVAQNILEYREKNGRFEHREQLKEVPRLGEKTYEQAVGFLRIMDGTNPLDASAVHPESYSLIEKIIASTQSDLAELIGNSDKVAKIKPQDFVSDEFGLPTILDVLEELKKPGRDPRPEFKMATFKEGVEKISDLKPDMKLEGVVTNVTNFGAFVDIGVHQDGLVHVSEMSNAFISDPAELVKAGDIVNVKVLDVDVSRKRIQLTMKEKSEQSQRPQKSKGKPTKTKSNAPRGQQRQKAPKAPSPFGAALEKALGRANTENS